MEVDPPTIESLPFEVLLAIAELCGPEARRQLSCCTRQWWQLCCACRASKQLTIYGTAPPHPFQWRRHVWLLGGGVEKWCQLADASALRSLVWTINGVLQPFFREQPPPPKFFCALPPSLQHLELQPPSGMLGNYLLSSLTASLPAAQSLGSLTLTGLGVAEFAHVVNALSTRANGPYNTPLTTLSVAFAHTGDVVPKMAVDVSGLKWLSNFRMTVHLGVPTDHLVAAQTLCDQILAVGEAPMSSFEYSGPPLTRVDSWTRMVYRSTQTLTTLVMPQFAVGASVTDAEMAVDAAAELRSLVVGWQAARLDFMLKNKNHLEVLHHYGAVMSGEQLLAQLAGLPAIRSFYLATMVGLDFAQHMAQRVRWAGCQSFSLASLPDEVNRATQARVAMVQ